MEHPLCTANWQQQSVASMGSTMSSYKTNILSTKAQYMDQVISEAIKITLPNYEQGGLPDLG
jgi:hypothetical protein